MKKSIESYLEKGRAEDAAGNYEEARKAFTKAIELDPNNAQAYYERGILDLNHICSGHAIFDFEKALELDPNLSDAYLAMARYWVKNMWPVPGEMIEMMINFSKLRPNDHWEYSEKVLSYFFTEKFDVAIDDIPMSINRNPMGSDSFHYNRGCICEKRRKYEQAISYFKKALNINPNNPKSYFRRGHCFAQLHNLDLAMLDFKAAVVMIIGSGF